MVILSVWALIVSGGALVSSWWSRRLAQRLAAENHLLRLTIASLAQTESGSAFFTPATEIEQRAADAARWN